MHIADATDNGQRNILQNIILFWDYILTLSNYKCINRRIVKFKCVHISLFFCGAATQRGSWPPHSWGFLYHTQRRTTVGRTPLDEWSARRRGLYLATHNNHNRQTSISPVGFEPTISSGERPQTDALDRAANTLYKFDYHVGWDCTASDFFWFQVWVWCWVLSVLVLCIFFCPFKKLSIVHDAMLW